ncbi:MAG: cytochrome c oxidase assembly factor 1 family protein [Anaerolineales bacterium]|nr:cytochrome c oxidase assembly factor 1 family protein [Anaerolineales bacterium]
MENPTKKKSWFARFWWVLILAACLLLTMTAVCVVGTGAAGVFGIFGLMKSNPAYQDSLAAVQADSRAQQLLGTPIEAGWLVNGSISETPASGTADISYSVSGPKGSGTVYVTARKMEGEWVITKLTLVMDGTNHRLVIIGGE